MSEVVAALLPAGQKEQLCKLVPAQKERRQWNNLLLSGLWEEMAVSVCLAKVLCSSQQYSAPQHFAAYVKAWQQELIVLSVLSATRIACLCSVMVIWFAYF